MEILLATPQSRSKALRQKMLGLLVAEVIVIALIGLGMLGGVPATGESLDGAAFALTMLNILALVNFWGAIGLLAGQLVIARRQASGTVGGLMFATYLLNNIFESTPSLNWLSWLIPFHYYSLSKPLALGHGFNFTAWLVLVILGAASMLLADLIFIRRDIGRAYSLLTGRTGSTREGVPARSSAVFLGSVFGKAARDLVWPTLAWGIGLGLYGVIAVSTTKEALGPMQQIMKQLEQNQSILAQMPQLKLLANLASNEAYLALFLFAYLPVLLAIFSIIQVDSWASDEEEGRLEVLVSMPMPRWRVLIARYMAMVASLVAILALTGVFVLGSALLAGVTLDAGRIVGGLFATLPVALVVAAFGLCVATWPQRPSYAMPVTIAVVVVMFFLQTLGPLFNLPESVLSLSIFYLYGNPLIEGLNWSGLFALSVATLLLAAASFVGLGRRDIVK